VYTCAVAGDREVLSDRRRHVRVRPARDYEVGAQVCEGAVFTRAQVVDLSLGGVALLLEPPLDQYAVGAMVELRFAFPGVAPVRVSASVRHRARGVCGTEFRDLSPQAAQSLQRAVSELLERGHSS
jgi:c-di-GMP-binding flagellar brake protein YcgR